MEAAARHAHFAGTVMVVGRLRTASIRACAPLGVSS
ncbi:hypothetical protein MXAN_7481 [Myxococcus xanthus DK 1622]|uniref:Uncharacterized protein n=1 Tax=Myxococcus xanthus (strain DK1622) TaxID=246197 RepID=Q1CVI8_MYXXD|nr:hypothetical protein MXAN_7481 [Myxococcus xanthus DK 1622]